MYTDEEIKAMQEEIPEWKRTSLVVDDREPEDSKKKGMFKRAFGSVSSKVGSTKFVQNIAQSEEYKKF